MEELLADTQHAKHDCGEAGCRLSMIVWIAERRTRSSWKPILKWGHIFETRQTARDHYYVAHRGMRGSFRITRYKLQRFI